MCSCHNVECISSICNFFCVVFLLVFPIHLILPLNSVSPPPPQTENALSRRQFGYPPPLCPSPPLVLPQGGVGDRHFFNPEFFVAPHCVVVEKPPPKSAAQSIPVESGEHVQEFKVKWSMTKKIYTELVKE